MISDAERRLEMDPFGHLGDHEWAAICNAGLHKVKAMDNFITDEEFLVILFADPEYSPKLHMVPWDQGWRINLIMKEARENMADFLALPDARELFGLPASQT